jgi:hypothetical protein
MELLMPQSTVLKRIRQLETERSALLEQAREEVLIRVRDGIDQLRHLGFNYTLVEDQEPSSTPNGRNTRKTNGRPNGKVVVPGSVTGDSGKRKRTRRTGIRQDVLAAIASSGKKGMTRGELITAFRAKDDSFKQSISNALVALKKQKEVRATSGVYKAAARKQ